MYRPSHSNHGFVVPMNLRVTPEPQQCSSCNGSADASAQWGRRAAPYNYGKSRHSKKQSPVMMYVNNLSTHGGLPAVHHGQKDCPSINWDEAGPRIAQYMPACPPCPPCPQTSCPEINWNQAAQVIGSYISSHSPPVHTVDVPEQGQIIVEPFVPEPEPQPQAIEVPQEIIDQIIANNGGNVENVTVEDIIEAIREANSENAGERQSNSQQVNIQDIMEAINAANNGGGGAAGNSGNVVITNGPSNSQEIDVQDIIDAINSGNAVITNGPSNSQQVDIQDVIEAINAANGGGNAGRNAQGSVTIESLIQGGNSMPSSNGSNTNAGPPMVMLARAAPKMVRAAGGVSYVCQPRW